MALNRWISAALLVSVLGFAGCTQPTPKNPGAPASPAATAPTQTPDAPVATETPTAPETPTATPTGDATPSDTGTPTAAAAGGDHAAMLEDLENADGMTGYDEVKAMTPPASFDLKKGQELFTTSCASCHGDKGLGDGSAGASLDPKPRDLTKPAEYKYGNMHLAVYRTGMYGIEGTGMAPWEGVISPEEMWEIVGFVESLHK